MSFTSYKYIDMWDENPEDPESPVRICGELVDDIRGALLGEDGSVLSVDEAKVKALELVQLHHIETNRLMATIKEQLGVGAAEWDIMHPHGSGTIELAERLNGRGFLPDFE